MNKGSRRKKNTFLADMSTKAFIPPSPGQKSKFFLHVYKNIFLSKHLQRDLHFYIFAPSPKVDMSAKNVNSFGRLP